MCGEILDKSEFGKHKQTLLYFLLESRLRDPLPRMPMIVWQNKLSKYVTHSRFVRRHQDRLSSDLTKQIRAAHARRFHVKQSPALFRVEIFQLSAWQQSPKMRSSVTVKVLFMAMMKSSFMSCSLNCQLDDAGCCVCMATRLGQTLRRSL